MSEARRRANVVANIFVAIACMLFTVASVLAALELKPWRVQGASHCCETIELPWTFDTPKTPDGWWNPGYTKSMEGSRRAWEDRWQIGNRVYRTKDLMGRRI
jgi:hypothetical protein